MASNGVCQYLHWSLISVVCMLSIAKCGFYELSGLIKQEVCFRFTVYQSISVISFSKDDFIIVHWIWGLRA